MHGFDILMQNILVTESTGQQLGYKLVANHKSVFQAGLSLLNTVQFVVQILPVSLTLENMLDRVLSKPILPAVSSYSQ